MDAVLSEGPAGYTHLLADYARLLTRFPDDLVYLNLEHPLVQDQNALDGGWPRQDTSRERRAPILGATPPLADALAGAGVHVVSLANNHAYDQDHAGLLRTTQELNRVGVAYAGAGQSEREAFAPVWLSRGGCRVALLSFSEYFNRRAHDEPPFPAAHLRNRERALGSVRAARETADLVVVALHWGRDFATTPRRDLERMAERLIDAGADVLLGTGPHVLQRVERVPSPRGEAVVAYSLGNFVSGMGRAYRLGHRVRSVRHPAVEVPEALDGVVLSVPLQSGSEGVHVGALSATMLFTENNWRAHRQSEGRALPHRVRVRILAELDEALLQERREAIASALGPDVELH
jgi:poly-gamma-glutamate synthesis protein (capsule biosynthesis protein)